MMRSMTIFRTGNRCRAMPYDSAWKQATNHAWGSTIPALLTHAAWLSSCCAWSPGSQQPKNNSTSKAADHAHTHAANSSGGGSSSSSSSSVGGPSSRNSIAQLDKTPVVLTGPVHKLWQRLQNSLSEQDQGRKPAWWQPLQDLKDLDRRLPHLMAWHVLPLVQDHLEDVGGPLWTSSSMHGFLANRAALWADYKPLVWALGLCPSAVLGTPSPQFPPPDPPLTLKLRRDLLLEVLNAVANSIKHTADLNLHWPVLCRVLDQLEQQQQQQQEQQGQQPEQQPQDNHGEQQQSQERQQGSSMWSGPDLAVSLGQICIRGGAPDTFWRLAEGRPALAQVACRMAPHLYPSLVKPLLLGLSMSPLLGACSATDIWQWVARCDHAAPGEVDVVLQVWGMLALVEPVHPALNCLGLLLLQYVHNNRYAASRSDRYYWGTLVNMTAADYAHEFQMERVPRRVIPRLQGKLTCKQVVEWLGRLQLVAPPHQISSLLHQLLAAVPKKPRLTLSKSCRLELCGLLLDQLARQERQQQQQEEEEEEEEEEEGGHLGGKHEGAIQRQWQVLPPAAASMVLEALPDASKGRSAATKVLLVWHHMAGALDPAWCASGLAAAAKTALGAAQRMQQQARSDTQQQQTRQRQDLVAGVEEAEKAGGARAVVAEGLQGADGGAAVTPSPSPGDSSSTAPDDCSLLLQQLSERGQQQVQAAAEKLGLKLQVLV